MARDASSATRSFNTLKMDWRAGVDAAVRSPRAISILAADRSFYRLLEEHDGACWERSAPPCPAAPSVGCAICDSKRAAFERIFSGCAASVSAHFLFLLLSVSSSLSLLVLLSPIRGLSLSLFPNASTDSLTRSSLFLSPHTDAEPNRYTETKGHSSPETRTELETRRHRGDRRAERQRQMQLRSLLCLHRDSVVEAVGCARTHVACR